jgi:hypothetical protein
MFRDLLIDAKQNNAFQHVMFVASRTLRSEYLCLVLVGLILWRCLPPWPGRVREKRLLVVVVKVGAGRVRYVARLPR